MSAVNFFTQNPIKTSVKFPKEKVHFTENLTLNYQLLTFITQDLVPSIEQLQEDKIISKSSFYTYLKKLIDGDSDNMHSIYKEAKKQDEYIKDYDFSITYFKKLASKQLSDYQKNNDPFLEDLLYVIISCEFIINNSHFIAIANHQPPNYKVLNQIEQEMKSIRNVFDSRYMKVSNQKFIHGQYKKLFDKIKYSSHKEFLKLTE